MIRMLGSIAISIAFLATFSSGQQKHIVVKVANPSDRARESETISIPWDTLKGTLSLGTQTSLVVKETLAGNELVSQLVDDDLNGLPDEFIFQSGFRPLETKSFLITVSIKDRHTVASLVDARYVEPREDLAWENDRIAFRVYGPALAAEVNNGIDVWTKRVRYPIVKKWYEGEEQTPKIVYHEDHGEGADFFNVGRSLGCGGTGIWFNGRVYQPGVFTSYEIISTGPIRTSFRLLYDSWNVVGTLFKEVKKVTLDAGQNLNRIEVTLKGGGDDDLIGLASGLIKRDSTKFYKNSEGGWMSLWGKTNNNPENGSLGTGVIFKPEAVTGWAEDSSQYIILGETLRGTAFTYYAGAGWTRSGDFKSVDGWNLYLDQFSKNFQQPLQIGIVHEK